MLTPLQGLLFKMYEASPLLFLTIFLPGAVALGLALGWILCSMFPAWLVLVGFSIWACPK